MNELAKGAVESITRLKAGHSGEESAREINISAVRSAVNTVESTLGPRGKDKLIEQRDGEVLVTNDAETILSKTVVDNPAAVLTIDVAKAVGREYRDGTTTAVLLTGALLDEAEALLDQGVTPTKIARGYDQGQTLSTGALDDLAEPVDPTSETVHHVAETAMAGNSVGGDREKLAELVVSATESVRDGGRIDTTHVQIVTQTGQPISHSKVIQGAALTADPVRQSMPNSVEGGQVLLTTDPVQLSDTRLETSIDIEDAESFHRFFDRESEEIRGLVDKILDVGADAVLCSGSIADEAQSVLSLNDILAVRQVDNEMLSTAAAVLGGSVVSSVPEVTVEDLGTGRLQRDENDELFLASGGGAARATIVLRGPTQQVVDELKHHVESGLEVVAGAMDGGAVTGGGATELELARQIRDAAQGVVGREHLAVEAFADALEGVPKTLAENVGLKPIDAILSLRTAHDSGDCWMGIDASGTLADQRKANVIEPVCVKQQAISSAVEAAILVLRIDDVLTVDELSETL